MTMNKKAVDRAAAFLGCLADDDRIAALVNLLHYETVGWDNPKKTADTKGYIKLVEEAVAQLRTVKGKSNKELYDGEK